MLAKLQILFCATAVLLLCLQSTDANVLPTPPDCPVRRDVRLLVYNSVPKSGSTSFRAHLNYYKEKHFRFLQDRNFRFRRLTASDMQTIARDIQRETITVNRTRQMVFDKHMYFWNLEDYANLYKPGQIAYINVVRDPLQRFLSRYQYDHWISDLQKTPCKCKNLTVEECISQVPEFSAPWKGESDADLSDGFCIQAQTHSQENLKPCYGHYWDRLRDLPYSVKKDRTMNRELYLLRDEAHNYLTKHLCGSSDVCHAKGEDAFKLSQQHIDDVYSIVGLTNEVDLTFFVTVRMFPSFFGPITDDILYGDVSVHTQRSPSHSHKLRTESAQEWFRDANQWDSKLYAHVVERFRKLVPKCLTLCEAMSAISYPPEIFHYFTEEEVKKTFETLSALNPSAQLLLHERQCLIHLRHLLK